MYKYLQWIFLCSLLCRVAAGGKHDMTNLLSFLFTDYDTSALPITDSRTPIQAKVGIGVMSVIGLDTKSQVLSLRGYAMVEWVDPYLSWDPRKYGNISYIVTSQDKAWKPDLVLTNALSENIFIGSGSDETRVIIYSNGTIKWEPAYLSGFLCEVDVTKFPVDVNICPIMLSPWMFHKDTINLTFQDPHTVLENFPNGQFEVEILEPKEVITHYHDTEHQLMHFYLKLSRRSAFTFISMLLPMFVIGLLTPISFLIPPDNSEKLGISLTVLLSAAVCIGAVHGDLPDRSDRISSVVVFVISLLVLSFLGVFGNVVVMMVHRAETEKDEIPSNNIKDAVPESFEKQTMLNEKRTNDNDPRNGKKETIYHVSLSCFGKRKSMSRASMLNWVFFYVNVIVVFMSSVLVLTYIFS